VTQYLDEAFCKKYSLTMTFLKGERERARERERERELICKQYSPCVCVCLCVGMQKVFTHYGVFQGCSTHTHTNRDRVCVFFVCVGMQNL